MAADWRALAPVLSPSGSPEVTRAGTQFEKGRYGEPSEKALEQAHEKARLLGGGAEVEASYMGFTRLTAHTAE